MEDEVIDGFVSMMNYKHPNEAYAANLIKACANLSYNLSITNHAKSNKILEILVNQLGTKPSVGIETPEIFLQKTLKPKDIKKVLDTQRLQHSHSFEIKDLKSRTEAM
jgi:hypothetical protein